MTNRVRMRSIAAAFSLLSGGDIPEIPKRARGVTIKREMSLRTEIARATESIVAGGVVAIPTDTLYGLAADALNPKALDRVYQAKGRPADMPLPVLVSGWEQARMVASVPTSLDTAVERMADAFWPGSLTLVLPVAPGLPARLTAGRDTIAVRIPN